MEIYLPTLESKMVALVAAFRFIVFAIMVVGLIVYAASGRGTTAGLFLPLVRALILTAAVATMDSWFPRVETAFLSVAEYINPGYNEHPTAASDTIRESTTSNPEGQEWSWRKLNQSIYQAVTNAIANIFIYVGTLLTVPMLILQYVLRWLLYLVTPFMLALLMVPGFSGIPVRFFQQVLAILAWPVGFAITNLVALAVWNDFRNAVGANPASPGDALYSPLLTFMGGILATIMIIVGTLATPVVMQTLFAQGHAFTGASGNFATIVNLGSRTVSAANSRSGRGGTSLPATAPAITVTPPPAPMGAGARPGI